MPTYEYVCNSCEAEMEFFQGITENPKRKCPECGKQALQRQISSGGGILFKGSGFYETDYRSADYKKAAAADKESSSSSKDSKSSGDKKSGDSTPAVKKAAKSSEKK